MSPAPHFMAKSIFNNVFSDTFFRAVLSYATVVRPNAKGRRALFIFWRHTNGCLCKCFDRMMGEKEKNWNRQRYVWFKILGKAHALIVFAGFLLFPIFFSLFAHRESIQIKNREQFAFKVVTPFGFRETRTRNEQKNRFFFSILPAPSLAFRVRGIARKR